MLRSSIVGAFAAMTLAAAPQAAIGQELDSRCQKIVDALCDGKRLGKCFQDSSVWDNVPARCQGDVQTMIEMEREALQERREERREERRQMRRPSGQSFSCGGILRAKPSMKSAKVASVAAGQELDTVEDTGVWTDEYKWFRVTTNGFEGYHWGGIFWTRGGREGTIPSCDG